MLGKAPAAAEEEERQPSPSRAQGKRLLRPLLRRI
jgi:hypothetical protein